MERSKDDARNPSSTLAGAENYLQRLGLAPNCTESDVRAAYLRLAKNFHPDRGGDAQFFQQLQSDYEHALAYAKRRRVPKVHSFFLSPWTSSAIDNERRRAKTIWFWSAFALVQLATLLWFVTGTMVFSVLVILFGVFLAYVVVSAQFHPIVAAVNCALIVIFFVAILSILFEDRFFIRFVDGSVRDFSGTDQIQISLLLLSALMVPVSAMTWIASLTDRIG